jgi:hypothetical protein
MRVTGVMLALLGAGGVATGISRVLDEPTTIELDKK